MPPDSASGEGLPFGLFMAAFSLCFPHGLSLGCVCTGVGGGKERERERQRDGETERDTERWSEAGELTGLALSGTGERRLRGQAELPSLLAANAQGPLPAALQGPPRCAPVGAPATALSGGPPPSDNQQAPSVCSSEMARGWLRMGRCLNLRNRRSSGFADSARESHGPCSRADLAPGRLARRDLACVQGGWPGTHC